MNPNLLVLFRSIAAIARIVGETKLGDSLDLVVTAAESGTNVDAYMGTIAAKLKAGEQLDPDDIKARIAAEEAALQAPIAPPLPDAVALSAFQGASDTDGPESGT